MVHATFPEDYPVKELAGKKAEFDCKIKEVGKPVKPAIDDELAKGFGVDSLDKLREMVTDQIRQGYEQAARLKLKRELLDALDAGHTFDLPPTLVDSEFKGIWQQVESQMKAEGKSFPDEGKTEDESKAEYRKIAERRVRLGLVIGEIGEKNKITVSEEELRRALAEQVRRYPGQERMVYEYYQKNPQAVIELRAPIFEDKVVDYVIELAKPAERKVSKDELMKAVEAATEG
jgi:trigger factor